MNLLSRKKNLRENNYSAKRKQQYEYLALDSISKVRKSRQEEIRESISKISGWDSSSKMGKIFDKNNTILKL